MVLTKLSRQQFQAAFSLIELMVTLAIIAILVSIGYPSYQQYVLKTYRSEASSQLLVIANAQEQYMADHGVYSAELSRLGWPVTPLSGRYRFRIRLEPGAQGFSLSATATGLQQADTECAEFTLNHLGQRNLLSPQYLTCWQ